jgi:hypothetical protein
VSVSFTPGLRSPSPGTCTILLQVPLAGEPDGAAETTAPVNPAEPVKAVTARKIVSPALTRRIAPPKVSPLSTSQ